MDSNQSIPFLEDGSDAAHRVVIKMPQRGDLGRWFFLIGALCVENSKQEYQITIFPLPLPCDSSVESGQTISYENEPNLVYIAAVRSHCRNSPFHLVQQG